MPEQYWNHNTAFHDEIVADAATRGGRVLDVGCGDGLLLERLAGVCDEVVGVESHAATVERARARLSRTANAMVFSASIMDVTSTRCLGTFQTVTCVAALHHLPLEAGLKRLAGLVAPGGRLIVVGLDPLRAERRADPLRERLAPRDPRHRRAHHPAPRLPRRDPGGGWAAPPGRPHPAPLLLPVHPYLGLLRRRASRLPDLVGKMLHDATINS